MSATESNMLQVDGQHPLYPVFMEAIAQTTTGKGNERHGKGKPFMEHPWVNLADIHGIGGLTFQADKKMREAQSFLDGTPEGYERWKREMLGVLVYAGAALIYAESQYNTPETGNGNTQNPV